MTIRTRDRTFFFLGLLFAGALLLCGCRERRRSVGELYRRSASGVVFVANRYYYAMNIGRRLLYFSGMDESGNLMNLTDKVDSVTLNARTAFGTGFFIDSRGSILTNRHIVRPDIPRETAAAELRASEMQIRNYLEQIGDSSAAKFEREQLANVIIRCASNVRIALHKSRTGDKNMFKECRVTKVSGLDDTDLAIIQLTSRSTPRRKYIFHFMGKTRGKRTMLETAFSRLRTDKAARTLTAGTKLCMLGYQQQPDTATHGTKLKATVNKGEILFEPDGNNIMYSMPVTETSGGSPVMNMFGDVVCVNFVNINGKDSVNFGIPLEKIKQFLVIP